jgi:predicted metalloprotease
MRWRGERQSTNIEGRRGLSAGRVVGGGGLGSLLLLVLALVFGVDLRALLQQQRNNPLGSEKVTRPATFARVIPSTPEIFSRKKAPKAHKEKGNIF